MKLIHTADWHLGQSFHGQERFEEQRLFLDWLLATLEERQADALLVAGDIFDVVNPSLRAQELLYDFIVRAHRRLPTLDIVLIAGNHDSGNRIELPAPLMRSLRTRALGRVAWLEDGELDAQRLLVPLTDASGATRAWCLALPFLRPAEVTGRGLNNGDSDANDYPAGIARVHAALIEAARHQRQPDQALVAMSHAHLHGAAVSEHSERPIVIGGEEPISAALFPDDIAYVALGHLHRAQQVGEPRIRYSGSPLPMDFSEIDYPHQVVEVCLDGAALVSSEALMIPRPVEMLRRGTASGFAEVDFIGRDGRRYRARWAVRRARDKASGRLQAVEQSLTDLDSERLLTAQKREFAGLLTERLGLNFEQFTRAVLLAQSEFAAFLTASDNARSELLEKLTDTAEYSAISKAAYARSKAARDALAVIEARLADQAPADAEARQAMEAAERSAEQALAELERRLDDLAQDYQSLNQRIERLRAVRSDSVARLRQRLEDGTPCPVCGGTEHPWRHQPPATPEAAQLAATQREEQRQLDEAERELARQQLNRWGSISELIGASDGKTFRRPVQVRIEPLGNGTSRARISSDG